MSETEKRIAVLVTTGHRGVFMGYVDPAKVDNDVLDLERARLCIYWSADVKGFLGLAAAGPTKNCKVGPKVPELALTDVTSVSKVTPEAQEQWEKAPWAI